jgi:endonuclease/exonuclease/phosphatase family metal-dependent hydrolase
VAVPEFMLVASNVENLFDIDGIAVFDDYAAATYGPRQLLVKLKNIATVMRTLQEGRGPDIMLIQEIEADQSPAAGPVDYEGILKRYASRSLASMLTEPIARDIQDLPAEAFLVKAFAEAGLGPYHIAVSEYRPDPSGRTVAHVNATFSRFPIARSRTLQSAGARGTLEVVHQIGTSQLTTFNCHWKSGASNPEDEPTRIGNAKAVRDRLDAILRADPAADVVIGGDFNSQYNQSQRYPGMGRTAMNSVLGSQGSETAIRGASTSDLYNLWYELPPDQRRSDAYQGSWGTLMNMMITRGLYDGRGVQYVDNSFRVVALENLNAQASTGLPMRWRTINGEGAGFSDHLPIAARFRVVEADDAASFTQVTDPGAEGRSPAETDGVKVDYRIRRASIPKASTLGSDSAIQKPEFLGHLFLVDATVTAERPLRIRLFRDEYKVWSFDEGLRKRIYKKFPVGSTVRFYGELDIHDGMWQFLIHDGTWLEP